MSKHRWWPGPFVLALVGCTFGDAGLGTDGGSDGAAGTLTAPSAVTPARTPGAPLPGEVTTPDAASTTIPAMPTPMSMPMPPTPVPPLIPPLLAAGQPCTSALACATGICTEGVCCNTVCAGPCASCALAATVGVCTALPHETACGTASCVAGVELLAAVCDGKGACLPSKPHRCKDDRCGKDGRCAEPCPDKKDDKGGEDRDKSGCD